MPSISTVDNETISLKTSKRNCFNINLIVLYMNVAYKQTFHTFKAYCMAMLPVSLSALSLNESKVKLAGVGYIR